MLAYRLLGNRIMTTEQQKNAERLDRYIVREGLASVMNNTKWREAIQVLQDVMGYPRFRVKNVRGSEPPAGYWDGSFPYHVPPYKTIEWMEINMIVGVYKDGPETGRYCTGQLHDNGNQVAEAFNSKGIPFYRSDGIISTARLYETRQITSVDHVKKVDRERKRPEEQRFSEPRESSVQA